MTEFTDAAKLIASVHNGELAFDHANQIIRSGKVKATPVLNDQLWAACGVIGGDDMSHYKKWDALRREVQMKLLGVTEEQVQTSTQQYGPRYNKLDSKGFLVPASFDPNSIPKEGDTYFRGVRATKKGEIDFFFEQRPGVPSMIFSQDIDVALIVAFHPSRPLLPSLSLEGLDEDFPDRPKWNFIQKEWRPRWIGHTMIGETLYAADYWIGQLAWNSKSFPVTPKDIPDPEKRARVVALLKEFELCGGQADGYSSRVMLKPGDVHGTWNKTKEGDIVCDVHRIDMGVDGSNMAIKIDPKTNAYMQDRVVNLNDPRFAMGRVALLLSAKYDEIAELFPMFERGRQMVGLLKTLVTLRDKHNFQPSTELAKRIDQAYQYYTKKPTIALRQRLCLQLSAGD